jgi:integrase
LPWRLLLATGHLAPQVNPQLREHLDAYVEADSATLVFTGQRGGVLRRGNFRKASGWPAAATGLPGLHLHDLRHTGNTLAAQAGVSLADLKARMGHDSVRAAMIYQHAAAEADQKIANNARSADGKGPRRCPRPRLMARGGLGDDHRLVFSQVELRRLEPLTP